MFMFTPLMEFGFVQRINIYSPDEKSFIRFMMASRLDQNSWWDFLNKMVYDMEFI